MFSTLIALIITSAIFNNIILSQFLGICPFLGVSKSIETASGMGLAVLFVMVMANIITYFVQILLVKAGVGYLQTLAFILVIASLVQMVEIILKKIAPALYKSLGIFLPLITTNCAVLGAALIAVKKNYGLLESTVYAAATAIGFIIAIVLFAGLRENMKYSQVPEAMQGLPIALITTGIMSLAFMGFAGFKLPF
jgi:electron transport complex protein RnfA